MLSVYGRYSQLRTRIPQMSLQETNRSRSALDPSRPRSEKTAAGLRLLITASTIPGDES